MKYISHRGLSTNAQEHSTQAILNAISAGFDAIEVDVRLTADNHLVLSHDQNLGRLYDSNLKIDSTSFDKLSQTVKESGGDFLTLSKALHLVARKSILMIELKGKGTGRAINQVNLGKNIIVTSFQWSELEKVNKTKCDSAKLRRWWPFVSKNQIAKYGIKYIGLRKNLVFRFTVNRAKNQGLQVFAWTVNNTKKINRFESIGVDYVVCDIIPKSES